MKRRLRYCGSLIVLAIGLSLATAACSSDSTPSSSGTTAPPSQSPSPSPTATASDDNGGGGGGSGASIQAGLGGFVFSPNAVTVSQGAKVIVKNVGTVPHTFTIQDKGINEVLNPGQSEDVKIDLPAGTYPFVCTFHQSSGMTGTLTVT
jgi:plastocyanin